MNWLPRRRRVIRTRLIQAAFVLGMSVALFGFIWIGLFIAAEKGW